MLLLDKAGTLETVTETHLGRNVKHTEHFDGHVDAEVRVKSLRMSFVSGAPPVKELVHAIAELEAATKEWRMAKHSKSDDWIRYAKVRLAAANVRVKETQ